MKTLIILVSHLHNAVRPLNFSSLKAIEKKWCFMDTSGFGDTRALDQEDRNMPDILEHINNLTHLNAVCFLPKPNSSKLHVFVRMCFIQLLDLVGVTA